MLHVALVAAVVFLGGQSSTLITPAKPVPNSWDVTPKLKDGTPVGVHFDFEAVSVYVDGPRLQVPCVGPSEEANMKGWSDGNLDPRTASDRTIAVQWQTHSPAGGRPRAIEVRTLIRNEQTKIENQITQMYLVRPGEGSGPRTTENTYRYRYQKMNLRVTLGPGETPMLLSTFYVPVAVPVLESSLPCGATPKERDLVGRIGLAVGAIQYASDALPPCHKGDIGGFVGATFSTETAGAIKDSGFAIHGMDINAVTIQEPDFGKAPNLNWIFLPSGTVLVPSADGYQSMIVVDPLLLTKGEYQTLLDGEPLRSIAVHCLEIDKKQPDPSVTFTPAQPSDPILRNLATFTQRASIKGPWDQARLWIYTDKATLDRINKRLAIGCPPGMFVRSLWEVQTMAGLDDKDLDNPELFKPELLGAVSNKKEAANWFAWILATRHKDALLKYLDGGAKELADMIASTNPLAADQFGRTIAQLLNRPEDETRIATLKFLDAQDATALKKAFGKPGPKWERHIEMEGEEAELGKKLKDKLNG